MTINEWVTKFKEMVDDELDSDYQFQLANDAMNEVEEESTWEVLKKSTTFSAATLTIPTDFGEQLKMNETGSNISYNVIPYEDQDIYDSVSYTYYFDWENDKITLTDSSNVIEKRFSYKSFSADLTTGQSWGFPSRFHSIIPLKMAKIYYAADAGEKSRAWDDRWNNEYNLMLNRMKKWNDKMKVTGKRRLSRSNYNPQSIN